MKQINISDNRRRSRGNVFVCIPPIENFGLYNKNCLQTRWLGSFAMKCSEFKNYWHLDCSFFYGLSFVLLWNYARYCKRDKEFIFDDDNSNFASSFVSTIIPTIVANMQKTSIEHDLEMVMRFRFLLHNL